MAEVRLGEDRRTRCSWDVKENESSVRGRREGGQLGVREDGWRSGGVEGKSVR